MSDPLAELDLEDDVHDFLATVRRMVSIQSVIGETDEVLNVRRFSEARTLGILDAFTDLKKKEKANLAGMSPQHASKVRKRQEYGLIKDRLVGVAMQLADQPDMKSAAKKFEGVFVQDQLTTALTGKGREKETARRDFIDRQSAKMTRDETVSNSQRLPKGWLDIFQSTREIEATITIKAGAIEGEVDDGRVLEIDGGTVPLPAAKEELGDNDASCTSPSSPSSGAKKSSSAAEPRSSTSPEQASDSTSSETSSET